MAEGRGDTDLYADVGARIMELYRQRIDGVEDREERALARAIERVRTQAPRLAGLRAERTDSYRIARIPQALGREQPADSSGKSNLLGGRALRNEMTITVCGPSSVNALIVFGKLGGAWSASTCSATVHNCHLLPQ